MNLQNAPAAKAEMLIRRPVAEVFEAFVDPAITTQFWFTRSSGRLAAGERVRWDWEMYGVHADVVVTTVEPYECLRIEWPSGDASTTVEWRFTARPDDTTFVSITETGFSGDGDAVVHQALDSAGGFALVLAGLKALLEHSIRLQLVEDRFPDKQPSCKTP